MPTREIARTEGKSYFDEFSQARAGEMLTVELVYNPQADPEFAVRRQPLAGITFEDKDGEGARFVISAGDGGGALTHTVTHPVHVYHKNARGLISDEVNVDEVVEITSTDDPHIVFLRLEPVP